MQIDKIEPPYWYTGMSDRHLQMLIYGKGVNAVIAGTSLPIENDSIKVVNSDSNDYAIIHLTLKDNAEVGIYDVFLKNADGELCTTSYELKEKRRRYSSENSISNSDCVYLVMPDRFSSDQPHAQKAKQDDWHGGNLRGLIGKLDYLSDLGVTAVWCTPVFKNQVRPISDKYYSYHGYSITDFYEVDAHFGNRTDYVEFVEEAHRHQLKVVMDVVFNHCSIEHPFVANPPPKKWINRNEGLTNYKTTTIFDQYASNIDKRQTVKGWFTKEMADLNLDNNELLTYMTQMTIWWIETASIDAIRMDTFLYSDLTAITKWLERLNTEYQGFSIIGETWMGLPAYTARTQKECIEINPSFIVMDFAFQHQLTIFTDDMEKMHDSGMYDHFLNDILYSNPHQVLAFLDNHDMPRWFDENDNTAKLKQAIGILLTSPRIPQIYYGTEILLAGKGESKGDGFYRRDFPGGWPDDKEDKTIRAGRSHKEQSFFSFIQRLLKWRKTSKAIARGGMKHYIPQNEVYVYFRTYETEKVMVVVNASRHCTLELSHYEEDLADYKRGVDILTNKSIHIAESMKLKSNEIKIIQLEK